MLVSAFFNQDACELAKALLGKVIRVKRGRAWLAARIIETEAYYQKEKGSHASLGLTPKRKALFMPPGTIYMYYARGGDSFNVSAKSQGNAVLIKSGIPYEDPMTSKRMIEMMQRLNPKKNSDEPRDPKKLCSGQTLLCKSLGIKVSDWDQQGFDAQRFYIDDVAYQPEKIIQTTRLGIPKGRDGHLPYRYIDHAFAEHCTMNPLRKRRIDYLMINYLKEK